jgi:hypothetical protein
MQAIWAIPVSAGKAADGGANTLSEVHNMREEWHEHQEAIEGLGDQGRIAEHPPQGLKP